MEAPTASPSAPEQLAFLLKKRSGVATDLQAEIVALQVKVQHSVQIATLVLNTKPTTYVGRYIVCLFILMI